MTSLLKKEGTRLGFLQRARGHGFGKVVVGFALRSAHKDADAFAGRIKAAVEAS